MEACFQSRGDDRFGKFALRQWQVGCWSHAVTRARAYVHTGARPPHRRLALRLSEQKRNKLAVLQGQARAEQRFDYA
jgi:hypothetical protein